MINWEQKTITGKSGKVYKIDPENITIGRLREYEILSLMLMFNSDFKTYYGTLVQIRKDLGELNINRITVDTINKPINSIDRLIAGIGNYVENPEPKIVRFCALFCNYEGENTSIYTNEQVKEKFEDWSHLTRDDFFLLLNECIPSLRKNSNLIKSQIME